MVKVFSNNQEFNISKSLYESIMKNNPELLQEKKEDSVGIKDFIAQMLKINGFNIDNVSKEERTEILKILSKKIEKGGNNSTEIKNVIKKFIDDYNKEDNSNDKEKPSDNNYLQDAKSDEVAKDIAEKISNVNSHESNDNQEQNNSESNLENNEENSSDTVSNNEIISDVRPNNEINGYPITYVSKDEYNERNKKIEQGKFNKEYFIYEFSEIIRNIIEEELKIDDIETPDVYENIENDKTTEEKVKQDAKYLAKKIKSISDSYSLKEDDEEKIIEIINQIIEIKIAIDESKIENNIFRYLTKSDFNKCFKSDDDVKEIKQSQEDLVENTKLIVKNYFFNTIVPESVSNFLKSCKSAIEKNIGISQLELRINDFGKKGPLAYLQRDIREIFVDTAKTNSLLRNIKINGIELWKIFKVIDPNDFWKNVAIIDCYSSEAYKTSLAQINQISALRGGELNVNPRYLPKGYNTQTTAYSIIKKPESSDPYAMRFKDSEKNDKNKDTKNDIDLKEALNNNVFPKIYIILVTEGIIKKWDTINNIKNKFSKLLKRDNNYLGKRNL